MSFHLQSIPHDLESKNLASVLLIIELIIYMIYDIIYFIQRRRANVYVFPNLSLICKKMPSIAGRVRVKFGRKFLGMLVMTYEWF